MKTTTTKAAADSTIPSKDSMVYPSTIINKEPFVQTNIIQEGTSAKLPEAGPSLSTFPSAAVDANTSNSICPGVEDFIPFFLDTTPTPVNNLLNPPVETSHSRKRSHSFK